MAIQASSSCSARSLSFQGCFEMVAARALSGAAPMPTSMPPAADAAVRMKWRRLKVAAVAVPCIATTSGLHQVRGAMNGAAQRLIRAAAADIGNTRVDVGVGRLGKGLQKCSYGHDLPGLAVAALGNAFFDPRALYRMVVVRGEAFDGDHLRAIESTDRHRTGPHGGAVNMHRASAALRDTATEFCARQTDNVAQHPEKRSIGLRSEEHTSELQSPM